LAGCTSLSPAARAKVDPHLDFASVQADPGRYADRFMLAGGAIAALREDGDGSVLEIRRWEMSKYGMLLAMADDENPFLVYSPSRLDSQAFAVGRLVTLCGRVIGKAALPGDQGGIQVLKLELDEINLLDTPFRYGLHRNDDPSRYTNTPTYVPPKGISANHPYDTSSYAYPYSPFTYRVR
jgi:hypothetical protein